MARIKRVKRNERIWGKSRTRVNWQQETGPFPNSGMFASQIHELCEAVCVPMCAHARAIDHGTKK